jgi:type III pantothenate kinase
MLLAIDIGNTNINLGVFAGRRLLRRYAIPTQKANYFAQLKKICARHKVKEAVICSVVPRATRCLKRGLARLGGVEPYYIGKEIDARIKNLYRRKREVGQDRLVNAYAGTALYGAPLIVVDFGTAVTFDVISKNREYLGGMILPGLEMALEALSQGTALLPRVKLARPREFIGRDTKNSILSGLVFGFAALTDDLAARIKNEIGRQAKVIVTGGNSRLIAGFCKSVDKLDPNLTLKGLNLLYRDR